MVWPTRIVVAGAVTFKPVIGTLLSGASVEASVAFAELPSLLPALLSADAGEARFFIIAKMPHNNMTTTTTAAIILPAPDFFFLLIIASCKKGENQGMISACF